MKAIESLGPASPAVIGSRATDYEAVVIGAGPYGLSAAAYLKSAGINVRVFGDPMDFWANKMPAGMLLRSPRVASNIGDPRSAFTLAAFEAASGIKPAAPLPLETFVEYGRWFEHNLGSTVERSTISRVKQEGSGFGITLGNGDVVRSKRVIVAAGVGPFHRKPAVFGNLPAEQAFHCYEGRKIADLAGRRIAVIGAGQSALESAALLSEAGSQVEVIAAISQLRWIGMRPWLHHLGPISKLLYSSHDVGPLGISRLVAMPKVVSHIPLKLRDKIRVRAVRPAGSKWLPERLVTVALSTGRTVKSAKFAAGEVQLKLDDGTERRVDHVLMGTGYDVEIARYGFLAPELVSQVRRIGGYPELGAGFSCSVPGLHFVGATAARSFGPLLYFVAGTKFASNELARYVSRRRT